MSVGNMFRRVAWLLSLVGSVLGAGPARADARAGGGAGAPGGVREAHHHPPLAPPKAIGLEVFGYLSLGEAERGRRRFAQAEAAGVLLDANPDWPRAHHVDLRSPAWRDIVLDRLIPPILAQGFDGVFLDTLDDCAFLEQRGCSTAPTIYTTPWAAIWPPCSARAS